jgi:hypothetical protein
MEGPLAMEVPLAREVPLAMEVPPARAVPPAMEGPPAMAVPPAMVGPRAMEVPRAMEGPRAMAVPRARDPGRTICDQRKAQATDHDRCVDAAAALAHSTTVSYAERGTGPVPEPQAVIDALRTYLDLQTIFWLAQRVLCLLASEADSERAVGQMRRALGDYASQMADDTLRRRVQMAMSQTMQGTEG